jgi:cytochrome c biogenesis protein CcmG, thiol:disulfide interchange protein DsbE
VSPSSAAQRGRGAGRASRPSSPASSRSLSRNWLLWVVIGVVVVAGILAIVISTGGDDGAQAGEVGDEVVVEGEALPALPSSGTDPAVGEPAPGLEGESPTGEAFDYRPGRGEPSLVVVLLHSCPHCQAEVPRIVTLADEGETEGVGIYAVTTGTSSSLPNYPPSEWLEREGWPFPILADTDDQTAATAVGTTAVPFMVFVDADGNVAGRTSGELSEEELAGLLDELRAGEPLSIPSAGAGTET